MYRIKVRRSFGSAHRLRHYRGKCENLHGHNWDVEVTAASEKLDRLGMVMDFGILKDNLDKVLSVLDHKYLNRLPAFSKKNPSSENVAEYIYHELEKKIGKKFLLVEVSVAETPSNIAVYTPD